MSIRFSWRFWWYYELGDMGCIQHLFSNTYPTDYLGNCTLFCSKLNSNSHSPSHAFADKYGAKSSGKTVCWLVWSSWLGHYCICDYCIRCKPTKSKDNYSYRMLHSVNEFNTSWFYRSTFYKKITESGAQQLIEIKDSDYIRAINHQNNLIWAT